MCGISAILNFGESTSDLEDLLAMHDAQAHRGPDGQGFLLVDASLRARAFRVPPGTGEVAQYTPRIALAVRRLRIVDLCETADQPLRSAVGRRWIVLNGEIYNHRQIRRLLESEGRTFSTRGDAEVALAAYERWGTACFERFEGMWALLFVDLERGVLVGSRDRLGIKPLFHARDGERVLIASEPQAIAAVQRGGCAVEAARFRGFLEGRPPRGTDLTFFRGVHPVPAATVFEIDVSRPPGVPVFRRFWDLGGFAPDSHARFEDAKEELLALLRASVRGHSQADVPVGCLLSGGLDSSMLARVLAASSTTPPPAFSIVYDDPALDESRYVDAVLDGGGLRGVRETLAPARAFELTDAVIAAQGEPLLGFELIAQYRAYGLAREHGAVVVLDGQGADEILGGYPFYEGVVLRERLAELELLDAARELRCLARKHEARVASVLRSHVLAPLKRRLAPVRYAWLEPDSRAPRAAGERSLDPWALNRLLYEQTRHTNLPAVLLHQDRSSMAHAVESRVPYLDHHIVELCFRLPPSFKVGFGARKKLLLEAARPYLPPAVIERRDKKAFVSTTTWLPLRDHAEALRALASAPRLLELPWLRRGPLGQFVEGYLNRAHDDTLAVWRLYTAARWLERFRPRVHAA
jgi:asparagine synthase (glutamine-hydrolysing)